MLQIEYSCIDRKPKSVVLQTHSQDRRIRMKRLTVVMVLVLMSGTVFAGGLTFGFKGGINLANVTGDDVENNETKLCFGGGAFLNIPAIGLLSVQPELLFMMKGMEFTSGSFDDAGVRMSYIDIPILAKVSIPVPGAFSPNVFVGPSVGFNTSAEAYIGSDDEDIKDQIKSTDFGLVFGGGFDYNLLVGQLTLDARYVLGLTSIDDTNDADDVKNTGIVIMAGYGFSL